MKQIDFTKAGGQTDTEALHRWLDRATRWITNGNYTLTLKRRVAKRTLAQNRLMWMWFACIEQETGQPQVDVHDYYCYKFLSRDIADPATGEAVRIGGHTSTLTTEAFTDFLNRVQADAATELGITLPTPEDAAWADFEDEYVNKITQ